jgi:para-aminobenzoate synthetase/4-amino-4-deoxychorismate lyase
MGVAPGSGPWAIVDFPGPGGEPVREVFREPVEIVEARTLSQVRPALDRIESLARSGLTMVGFVAYDAAPGLEPKFEIREGYDGPLAWFMGCHPGPDPGDRLVAGGRAPADKWIPAFDRDRYRQKVAEIIEGIGAGDYYQVNLTERFTSEINDPLAVYERLRAAQRAPYCAFMSTAEMAVVSVSPELFLHRSAGWIESRPMKGTARRGRWSEEDEALSAQLASSEKERAENVMIVDLIRNDMGRIAVPGSVQVPSMFTVESYPTVLQMTSHVRSQLKAGATLADIFAAMFPCGSVTGAPKIAASKSIRRLEAQPRGVYCGAVGVIRPGAEEFTFNVAIRTVTVSLPSGRATYGAGGGITADSDPDAELRELEAKAAVLTSIPGSHALLETMRIENGMIPRLERHLLRLRRSAEYLGLGAIDRITGAIEQDCIARASRHPTLGRLRLVVQPDGSYEITVTSHRPDIGSRRLGFAKRPVDSRDWRLYHKLADRTPYVARLEGQSGLDDVILRNERGELTETTIGNLVLEIDGNRLTPALPSGLLPGVYRAELLDQGEIVEAILTPEDLNRATRVWMINSLREWVECVVIRSA